MDNLISHIQKLTNLASTQSAYVSKPLLSYVLQWVELDINVKKTEIAVLSGMQMVRFVIVVRVLIVMNPLSSLK